jgi:hypothetical protein
MRQDRPITDARSALYAIDKRLGELWKLGSRFVAAWTLDGTTLIVATARIADLPALAASEPALLRGERLDLQQLAQTCTRARLRMEEI